MSEKIIHGDCVQKLREFSDSYFDLCITSPPYNDLRTYNGHCQWDFRNTAIELYRVLKSGGVLCWVVGDSIKNGGRTLTCFRQAIQFVDEFGFTFDDDIIWEKLHVAAPCSSRYHQMHEHVFILTKGAKKTFNPIKDRPNKWFGKSPFGQNTKRQSNGEFVKLAFRKPIAEFGKRANVWKGKSRAQEMPCKKLEHPAMMPKWLVRDLMKSWSNEGDCVLDPMAGSGTVGLIARQEKRSFVLIELNQDYYNISIAALTPPR